MSISDRFNDRIANEKMVPKSDFTRYFVYRKGQIVLSDVQKESVEAYCVEYEKTLKPNKNASLSTGSVAALRNHGFVIEDVFDEDGYRQAQRDRASRIKEIHEDFKRALFDEYEVDGPAAEFLYEKCETRASGDFEEIEDLFKDFVDCIGWTG